MDSDAVEEAAARWYTKYQGGVWSQSDQTEFDAWLNAATAHRIAYIRVEVAWQHAARMKALGAGIPAGVIPPRGAWGDVRFFKGTQPEIHTPSNDRSVHGTSGVHIPGTSVEAVYELGPSTNIRTRGFARAMRHAAIAAGLLLVVAGALYTYNPTLFARDGYSTKVGDVDTVPLADGSQITLNTNSHIRVVIQKKERRVELDQGEAFFEVARDPNRPFVVEIGNKLVTAVGTKFSVRREQNDIRVAVIEGKVRVDAVSSPLRMKDGDELISPSDAARPGSPGVFLGAGGVAQTSRTEILVNEHADSEVEQLLSWRRGYLVFRETTLADAVAEFNRYNVRKIVIEDPTVSAIRVGGNFRSNNTEAFLWLIQKGFPITTEDVGDRVILRYRQTYQEPSRQEH